MAKFIFKNKRLMAQLDQIDKDSNGMLSAINVMGNHTIANSITAKAQTYFPDRLIGTADSLKYLDFFTKQAELDLAQEVSNILSEHKTKERKYANVEVPVGNEGAPNIALIKEYNEDKLGRNPMPSGILSPLYPGNIIPGTDRAYHEDSSFLPMELKVSDLTKIKLFGSEEDKAYIKSLTSKGLLGVKAANNPNYNPSFVPALNVAKTESFPIVTDKTPEADKQKLLEIAKRIDAERKVQIVSLDRHPNDGSKGLAVKILSPSGDTLNAGSAFEVSHLVAAAHNADFDGDKAITRKANYKIFKKLFQNYIDPKYYDNLHEGIDKKELIANASKLVDDISSGKYSMAELKEKHKGYFSKINDLEKEGYVSGRDAKYNQSMKFSGQDVKMIVDISDPNLYINLSTNNDGKEVSRDFAFGGNEVWRGAYAKLLQHQGLNRKRAAKEKTSQTYIPTGHAKDEVPKALQEVGVSDTDIQKLIDLDLTNNPEMIVDAKGNIIKSNGDIVQVRGDFANSSLKKKMDVANQSNVNSEKYLPGHMLQYSSPLGSQQTNQLGSLVEFIEGGRTNDNQTSDVDATGYFAKALISNADKILRKDRNVDAYSPEERADYEKLVSATELTGVQLKGKKLPKAEYFLPESIHGVNAPTHPQKLEILNKGLGLQYQAPVFAIGGEKNKLLDIPSLNQKIKTPTDVKSLMEAHNIRKQQGADIMASLNKIIANVKIELGKLPQNTTIADAGRMIGASSLFAQNFKFIKVQPNILPGVYGKRTNAYFGTNSSPSDDAKNALNYDEKIGLDEITEKYVNIIKKYNPKEKSLRVDAPAFANPNKDFQHSIPLTTTSDEHKRYNKSPISEADKYFDEYLKRAQQALTISNANQTIYDAHRLKIDFKFREQNDLFSGQKQIEKQGGKLHDNENKHIAIMAQQKWNRTVGRKVLNASGIKDPDLQRRMADEYFTYANVAITPDHFEYFNLPANVHSGLSGLPHYVRDKDAKGLIKLQESGKRFMPKMDEIASWHIPYFWMDKPKKQYEPELEQVWTIDGKQRVFPRENAPLDLSGTTSFSFYKTNDIYHTAIVEGINSVKDVETYAEKTRKPTQIVEPTLVDTKYKRYARHIYRDKDSGKVDYSSPSVEDLMGEGKKILQGAISKGVYNKVVDLDNNPVKNNGFTLSTISGLGKDLGSTNPAFLYAIENSWINSKVGTNLQNTIGAKYGADSKTNPSVNVANEVAYSIALQHNQHGGDLVATYDKTLNAFADPTTGKIGEDIQKGLDIVKNSFTKNVTNTPYIQDMDAIQNKYEYEKSKPENLTELDKAKGVKPKNVEKTPGALAHKEQRYLNEVSDVKKTHRPKGVVK